MGSRENILNSIKSFSGNISINIKTFETDYSDIIETFKENAVLAGAVICENGKDIDELARELNKDYFIYKSDIGVAENGALWCQNLGRDREKLFICENLIIKIKKENILSNMHEAYEKVSFENREFGTFIAGPSKTADIEQSLVLGAHGAMKLFIILED